MTPIGHNKHTCHSMSTSLRTVVLAARWKGQVSEMRRQVIPGSTERVKCHMEWHVLHQTTVHLITYSGQWGSRSPSKCDHVLTRHLLLDAPHIPSLWLYIESNDLSLRQRSLQSITCDICDIACIPGMHLRGVDVSVKPSHEQGIHIAFQVQWHMLQDDVYGFYSR